MTLEEEKRLALLAAMLHIGGGGTKARVLDTIERLGILRLRESDKQVMENRRELKWRNDLAFIRKHLVQDGWVSGVRHDDWRITDTGRTQARRLTQNVVRANGVYVDVRSAAAIIETALGPQLTDESALSKETTAEEGAVRMNWTVQYERNPQLREAAIRHHGTECMACGFSFGFKYGELGKGFIEVHHVKPVSSLGGSVQIDPAVDLIVLCSNCHSITHRRKNTPLSLKELKDLLGEGKMDG